MKKCKNLIIKNKGWVFLFLIFVLHLFLRFYQLEKWGQFTWDQVDNAWTAKNLIVDHKLPLLGPAVKGASSNLHLGPAYYYLIAPFYWFFNLNPIASGVFAGFTSVFAFFIFFSIAKKLFSFDMALVSVFINTVSFAGITFDRVQWNVNFIPPLSLLIFYFLYKVLTGNEKYLLFLALTVGFFFHIHLTVVFFLLIILLSLPFFPRNRKLLKYIFFSVPLFLLWLIPSFIANLQNGSAEAGNFLKLGYHGLHLTRVMQLAGDAFIQFESFLTFIILKPLKFILVPLFMFVCLYRSVTKEKLLLCYLILLWFLVPWLVLATYSGEISDYYFSSTRPIAVIVIAYLTLSIVKINHIFPKMAVVFILAFYAYFNIQKFFLTPTQGLAYYREKTKKAIEEGKIIEFQEGAPESYIYYYYTQRFKK